jgi:hypothetical protein
MMARHGNNDEYIADMEDELKELREEVKALRGKRAKLNTSKSALRKELHLSEADVLFYDEIREFTTQYLFPRFKFLHEGWSDIDPTDRKCLSSVVRRHFPIKDGRVFEEEWSRIMVPTIASKYSQMRCNVNNMIRDAFYGEYTVCTTTILL